MRIVSPYAGKEIEIPEDKLPESPRFSLKCPFTGKKIMVERKGREYEASAAEPVSEQRQEDSREVELPTVEPDIFPPGARTAFLAVKDEAVRSAARSFLDSKDFYTARADDVLTAMAKLRLNSYDLIVIEESDDGERLLGEVASWPGLKRRESNVLLVGREEKSMQPSYAFTRGVNSYLNATDMDRAGELFAEALEAYEIRYRPLNRAAENTGA